MSYSASCRRRLAQPCLGVALVLTAGPAVNAQRGGNPADAAAVKAQYSKLEVRRYRELLQMEHAKIITQLEVKPEFALHAPTPTGQLERIGAYIPEFVYLRNGKRVVEDCKAAPTRRLAMFRWKAHHFRLEYGLEVIEITRRHREAA